MNASPSPDDIAQFNADVVAYMESHPGMWTLRTRPVPADVSPDHLLPPDVPYILMPSADVAGAMLIKYILDARKNKVK